MSTNRNFHDWAAIVILIVGALNWGLVGLFNFDLVEFIFGPASIVSRIIYALVGLSGLYMVFVPDRLICTHKTPSHA